MKKSIFLFSIFVLLGAGCENIQSDFQAEIPRETDTKVYCSKSGELVRNPVSQAQREYCFDTQTENPEVNRPSDYSFAIIDDRGERTLNFEIVHEKIMHIIIVRDDLTQFQHVHPEFDSQTGVFTLKNLTLPTEGNYIMYLDFTPTETKSRIVKTEEFLIGESDLSRSPDFTDFSKIQTIDKFKVTLDDENKKIVAGQDTKLRFTVEAKSGVPIEHVERYLGEFGHLVIIREDTYEYIHAHPPAKSLTSLYNSIPFTVNFPSDGKYKMFLEFKYAQKIYRTEYSVTVEKGQNSLEAVPKGHMEPAISH